MTPDEARALLDGTTPGPWRVDPQHSGEVLSPENHWLAGTYETEDQFTADELARAQADTALIAAAPTLAAMFAGMREEWAVSLPDGSPVGAGWGTYDTALEDMNAWRRDGYDARIVRRYVTTPEEA